MHTHNGKRRSVERAIERGAEWFAILAAQPAREPQLIGGGELERLRGSEHATALAGPDKFGGQCRRENKRRIRRGETSLRGAYHRHIKTHLKGGGGLQFITA